MVAPEPVAADTAVESENAPAPEPEIVEEPGPEIVEPGEKGESGVGTQTEIDPAEDGETKQSKESQERLPLKYLGFVPEVLWQVWVIILWIYGTVKGSLGPVKWSIEKVEVKAGPYIKRVYQSMSATVNPKAVLMMADSKVDGVVKLLDRILPESASLQCSRAYNSCTTTLARIWKEGVKDSAASFRDELLPVFESYVVWGYNTAIRIPLMPRIFAIARYLAVTMNKPIMIVKESGIPFAGYLSPLPVDYFDRLIKSD